MLANIFSVGLNLFAFVLPISLAATNIVFFPMAALWLFGARWTWPRWPPVWGWPEKLFLLYLGASLLSAAHGLDPWHSLREIKNKDFYIVIAIVLVALLRDRQKTERVVHFFMVSGILTAVWGLIQCAIGVSQTDKSNGEFLRLPPALAHWPRPILDHLSLLDFRVMGTRGHPLAYAECLLFTWAFALCFLLSSRSRDERKWLVATVLVGAGLLVSQSRGPWIAGGVILGLAISTSASRHRWMLAVMGAIFLSLLVAVPSLRRRTASIWNHRDLNQERLHMWHAGVSMWKEHPYLGVGPGNVKKLSPAFQNADERMAGPWGHLHSIYINGLAERGALGMAFFFLFMGALWREIWRAMRKSAHDPWVFAVHQAALLGILGFFIGGITEASYNTAVVIMTFYFVAGISLSLARHDA